MPRPPHLPAATLLSLAAALALPAASQAAVAWDESSHGDLAGSGLAPTPIVLSPGSNLLLGSTGRVAGVVDRDYFSFTLPVNGQLDTLSVLPGTTSLGAAPASFIAVQAGPQVTVLPTAGSAAGLLGWTHYGPNDIGTDILGLIGVGPGAIGFAGPLPTGTYSFWIQDTGTGVASYRLDLAVSVVPEPGVMALWLLGLAGCGVVAAGRRIHAPNRPARPHTGLGAAR